LTTARAFESDARLWRLRSTIASEMGREDDAAIFLERALDVEYQNLPPMIDLVSWRRDYGQVLAHCGKLARAARSLGTKPPADLEVRIVRVTERWRLHDPETADACDAAAEAVTELGDADLGWDYLTTAAVKRSPEQPPWRELAETRHSAGDYATAERAYAVACAGEPANADILWERARNLRQAGKKTEAAKLLRRLTDENWPAPIRERARWQLEKR
jgi:tetratricopeptide (TPR) repeat protein